jgi:hypothetical protein
LAVDFVTNLPVPAERLTVVLFEVPRPTFSVVVVLGFRRAVELFTKRPVLALLLTLRAITAHLLRACALSEHYVRVALQSEV